MSEKFSPDEVRHAIKQWIEYGESEAGKSHGGYFDGGGWAARVLRKHLEELEAESQRTSEEQP